jgi:hypothetical protein
MAFSFGDLCALQPIDLEEEMRILVVEPMVAVQLSNFRVPPAHDVHQSLIESYPYVAFSWLNLRRHLNLAPLTSLQLKTPQLVEDQLVLGPRENV